jgi:rhomboid protease GluP
MAELTINNKEELAMKLLHYFITEEGYNPIIIHGSQNEIWLENLNAPYRIVRIVTNYIHNKEQLEFDLYKTKTIVGKIKRKTFSFKMNALSIFLDLGDNVELEYINSIDCVVIKDVKDFNKYDKVKEVFPRITNKLKFVEDGIQLFSKITKEINEKNKTESIKTDDVFKMKKPYVTYIIMFICVLVFISMYIVGNGSYDNLTLINMGALYGPLVRIGQYERLITAAFIHIGMLHLFFNMYALNILGTQLESFYGKSKFIIIYLFSALTGSLMSITFNPEVIAAGASGAIFGLLGSMLYFGYHYRVYLGNAIQSRIIPVILLNLGIGFFLAGIDQFAHIGGLIGGILISMAVGVKYKTDKIEQINGVIMSSLFLIFLIYLSFFYVV